MEEPPLHCGDASLAESYRYLFVPTWKHPIAIRVFRSGEGYSIRAVALSGAGGYELGYILYDRTRKLSAKEWAHFKAAIETSEFWSRPTRPPRDCPQPKWPDPQNPDAPKPVEVYCIDDLVEHDGTYSLYEGQAGRYHLIDRWKEGHRGFSLAQTFLFLAKLPPEVTQGIAF